MILLAAPAGIAHEWYQSGVDPGAYTNAGRLPWMLTAMAWVVGAAVYGSIFLGIPAVFVNLLRLPLMRLLFGFCQSNEHDIGVALVGTFIMYELPVGLIVMLGPTKTLIYNYPAWLFFFAVSLPWLLGSLWATWSLRQELAVPVEEE